MPDVTLLDVYTGARQSWAAATTVSAVIPADNVFMKRVPEGTQMPYVTTSIKDVSAYFGGTEYFSGAKYIKVQQVTFTIHCLASFDLPGLLTKINNELTWSKDDPKGVWTIPNATVLSAMPETDDVDIEEERVNGVDVIAYPTTITIKLECDRG